MSASCKRKLRRKLGQKLSAKSLEIAEQLDETAKQRLLKPRPVVMSPKIDPELTFAPQINAKSQQILSEKQDTRNPHVRLHKEAIERISRRKDISGISSREQTELSHCTFKPEIECSEQSYKRAMGIYDDEDAACKAKVEERLWEWQARREERLQEQIRERESANENIAECTFKPTINPTSSKVVKGKPRRRPLHEPKHTRKAPSQRAFPSERLNSAKCRNGGVDKFLERQRRVELSAKGVKMFHMPMDQRQGSSLCPKVPSWYDSRAQDAGRRTTEGHAERYNEKSQVNCQARRLRCCDLGRKTSKALQLEYET